MDLKSAGKKRRVLRLSEGKFIPGEEKRELTEIKEKQREKFFRSLSLATELGFLIAIPLAGGVVLGVWVDNTFSTHPKFTLSLLGAGVVIACANLSIVLSEFLKKD